MTERCQLLFEYSMTESKLSIMPAPLSRLAVTNRFSIRSGDQVRAGRGGGAGCVATQLQRDLLTIVCRPTDQLRKVRSVHQGPAVRSNNNSD